MTAGTSGTPTQTRYKRHNANSKTISILKNSDMITPLVTQENTPSNLTARLRL